MSYQAIVARIQTRPHPNADRLQLGTVCGHQVVVGLETLDGTLGVFFPSDGELCHEFCVANQLYNEKAYAELWEAILTHPLRPSPVQDPAFPIGVANLPPKYGFFSARRRIRAQSFRGQKSDGYWTDLASLAWTGADLSALKEGETFDTLNGHVICQKYYTPATRRAMSRPQARKRRYVIFPEHVDTKQFRYFKDAIPADAVVYVSEKVHGTSMRYGHVPETLANSWWKRLLGHDPTRVEWKHLNGSRRVVLKDDTDPSYYGTNDFRYDVTQSLVLHRGEIVYGEIVGDVQVGQPIMTPQPIKDDVKHLKPTYGETMRYTYGCADGEHKLFVYRVTRINEDGIETDLSWPQVVQRCGELGLQTVPQIAAVLMAAPDVIQQLVERHVGGPSLLDARHIREGVVLRIESSQGITFLKEKNFEFKVLEGIIKDADTFVDTEEAA